MYVTTQYATGLVARAWLGTYEGRKAPQDEPTHVVHMDKTSLKTAEAAHPAVYMQCEQRQPTKTFMS